MRGGAGVEFKLIPDSNGFLCIDVRVLSDDATVQDYLDAFNLFQAEKVAPCDGCTNCCWERAPLTAPDVIRYAAAIDGAFGDGHPLAGEQLSDAEERLPAFHIGGLPVLHNVDKPNYLRYAALWFIREYGDIRRSAEADIYLKRLPGGSCVFLDLDKQCCRAYAQRPLVCQTYVCLPSSPLAEALRGQIVNEGENELARQLGEAASALPDVLPDALPDVLPLLPEEAAAAWREYRSRGFGNKKTFAEVLIREVVRDGLWDKLHT